MYRPMHNSAGIRRLIFVLSIAFLFLASGSGNAQEITDSEAEVSNLKAFPAVGPQLARILERGVIRIGLQRNYKPFHLESTEYPGIDVEIAKALAQSLGVQVEYHYGDVAQLIAMVNAEPGSGASIDIALGGISSGLVRARYVVFSDPYMITTPAALLNRQMLPPESGTEDFPRRKIESLADLRFLPRLTIGVKAGTVNERLLRSDAIFEKHTVQPFADREELLQALIDGDVDALVADEVRIRAIVIQNRQLLSRFSTLTNVYREEHISMALHPGDPAFLNYVNFFIKELHRTGKLSRLREVYLENGEWAD